MKIEITDVRQDITRSPDYHFHAKVPALVRIGYIFHFIICTSKNACQLSWKSEVLAFITFTLYI